MEKDPFDLLRFLSAQASTFETALGELCAGRKRSLWMRFIFPQLRGLGSSPPRNSAVSDRSMRRAPIWLTPEKMIESQAGVATPRIAKIIPKRIDAFARMKRPQRFRPALSDQRSKGLSYLRPK
jgi:hypothetical protein